METAPIPIQEASIPMPKTLELQQPVAPITLEFLTDDPVPTEELKADQLVTAIEAAQDNGYDGSAALDQARDNIRHIFGEPTKTEWQDAIDTTSVLEHRQDPVADALANGESAVDASLGDHKTGVEPVAEHAAALTDQFNGDTKRIVRTENNILSDVDEHFGLQHTTSLQTRRAKLEANLGDYQQSQNNTARGLGTERGLTDAAAMIATENLFDGVDKQGRGMSTQGREAIKQLSKEDPAAYNEIATAYAEHRRSGEVHPATAKKVGHILMGLSQAA